MADDLLHPFGRAELRQRPSEPETHLGTLEGSGVEQRAPELRHEKGVSLGQLGDRQRDVWQLSAAGTARRLDERGDLVVRQTAEPDAHDLFGSPQIDQGGRELLRNVGLRVPEGREDQHSRAA